MNRLAPSAWASRLISSFRLRRRDHGDFTCVVEAQRRPRAASHLGVRGGKTTFAAGAPDPVFDLWDGLGALNVPHFPLARRFDEVMEALTCLYDEIIIVVVGGVDWLEPLIWAQVCKDNNWTSIEDAGYGKGYIAALPLRRS